jgi:endonuclease/exonuclease/phosphatase family metal-dependent hydrolase
MSGGRIRWRTVQTVLDAGYVDGYRMKHAEAAGLTLPTPNPHIRIDYVFVPAPFSERVAACDVVRHPQAAEASDHYPVVADLVIS